MSGSDGEPRTASPLRSLEPTRRPWTSSEQRLVRAKIRDLQARSRRGRAVAMPIAGAVVLLLWLATMLASDAPPLVITGFWIVVGLGLALWTRRDMTRDAHTFAAIAARLQTALKTNAADVYTVKARAFAEFEEVEDEVRAMPSNSPTIAWCSSQDRNSMKVPSFQVSIFRWCTCSMTPARPWISRSTSAGQRPDRRGQDEIKRVTVEVCRASPEASLRRPRHRGRRDA